MVGFNPKGFHLKRQGECQAYAVINFSHNPSLLGRDETAVQIPLTTKVVSRKHCKIDFEGGNMYIEDLKSGNGTWINSNKLVKRTKVNKGDLIGIGINPLKAKHQVEETSLIYKACVATQTLLDEEPASNVSIYKLCNDVVEIIDNGGATNARNEHPYIDLTDEEESQTDKEWARKLSQRQRSNSPVSQNLIIPKSFESPVSPCVTSNLLQARECTVNIVLLSKESIERALNQACEDDSSSSEERTDTKSQRTRHKNEMPAQQRFRCEVEETMKRLKDIVDPDSESEPEEPKHKRSREQLRKVIKKQSDPLWKTRIDEHLKKNKQIAGSILPRKSIYQVPSKQMNATVVDRKLPDRIKDASINSTSIELNALKKPMAKRRMTICSGNNENQVVKVELKIFMRNVPTIVAPHIPMFENKNKPNILKRRYSVNMIPARRESTDAFREDLKSLKEARKEKLREIALNAKQTKEAQVDTTKKRVTAKPKAKLTMNNRGAFLTYTSGVKESVKQSAATDELFTRPFDIRFGATAIPKRDKPIDARYRATALTKADGIIRSAIASFDKEHDKRSSAMADDDNGICNNLQFYKDINETSADIEADINILGDVAIGNIALEQPPDVRFFQPLLTGHSGYSSTLKSILKRPKAQQKSTKKTLSWASERNLVKTLIYEREEEQTLLFPMHSMPTTAPPRLPMLELTVGNLQLMNRQTEEDKIINEILSWNPNILQQTHAQKSDSSHIKQMKMFYNSLGDYRKVLEHINDTTLQSKITNSYSKAYSKSDKWDYLFLENFNYHSQRQTRLNLVANASAQYCKTGMIILLKAKNRLTNQDFEFFGYVSSSTWSSANMDFYQTNQIVVDAMIEGAKLEGNSVLKSREVMSVAAVLTNRKVDSL